MSLFAQAPVLMLELLGAPPGDVGAYAAAAATAGLLTVLATATNRAYGRELALSFQRRDAAALWRLLAQRARWLVPVIAALLVSMLVLAQPILGLFRPLFADAGAVPLGILAFGSTVTVIFALSPTILKFSGENATLYRLLAAGAAGQLLLHLLLIPRFGATGAALAHMLTMLLLYGAFAVLGARAIRNLDRDSSSPFASAGTD